MANLNPNRLSVVMSAQDMADVLAALDVLKTKMPFLTALTKEEMMSLPKIDVSNYDFVKETMMVMQTENVPLPPHVNLAEISRDFELFEQLNEISLRVEQISTLVTHTRTLAGSEAYVSSLFVYRIVQAFADAGVPGYAALYDRLKQRFAGQGGSGSPTTAPENP